MRPFKNISPIPGLIQRRGKDHDPVRPLVWGTMPFYGPPVEVMSYPIPHRDACGVIDSRATIMVRMTVGDPTSIKEVPFELVSCFTADRHEWNRRDRIYYDNSNPSAFIFSDELEVHHG